MQNKGMAMRVVFLSSVFSICRSGDASRTSRALAFLSKCVLPEIDAHNKNEAKKVQDESRMSNYAGCMEMARNDWESKDEGESSKPGLKVRLETTGDLT